MMGHHKCVESWLPQWQQKMKIKGGENKTAKAKKKKKNTVEKILNVFDSSIEDFLELF